MKVKRMVKRLFAVGAGATMLGATAMGALAANLNQYPDMFVSDGTFDGLFVVGENAAAVDNLAMTDIAASMKYRAPAATSTTTVEGDAWMVESGSDVLEFTESIGNSDDGVVSFLDDSDLDALADGQLTNSQGTFKYEQFLHFDNTVINTTYEEADDDEVTALYLKIVDGMNFARYELNFLEAAESDIDASESYKLDDYEDKQLVFLGKTYDIVKAVADTATGNEKVTLTLMAGSARDTLNEGETRTFSVRGKDYEVNLQFTNNADQAKFVVNGQVTGLLDEGETETLDDGTVLGLSEVLYQDYAGGLHQAAFFLGADKIVLEDDDISVATSTDEMKVNDETIDGADVIITGTVLENSTSTTDDGELEIDTIQINMTAQEDYFVAAGEKLSQQAELGEKDLLFTQNWDLLFSGMNDVEVDQIKLVDKSGEKEYWLTFTNVNGEAMEFPVAYAVAGATMQPGSQDDALRLFQNNTFPVQDEDYFILNDDTDEDSVTNVVQYKGADDFSTSDPKVKFKILGTGETVDRPVTFATGANGATATLKLGGTTYTVANATLGGDVSTDDWNISITGGSATGSLFGGGYNESTGAGKTSQNYGFQNYLVTRGGAKVLLYDENATLLTDQLKFNISLIDNDRTDDYLGRTLALDTEYLAKGFNITAASQELDLGGQVGVTLTTPDDDDDNSYGYTVNGAWIQLNSPSGGGSSADKLTIDWPQKLRHPVVYVTSGATTTSTSATGDLTRVTVVDATKLDSEVASASAQNLVVVGGPCVNSVAAELLGNPSDCTEGFTPGKARVKLFEHANGNVAMLVAGYSGEDTRLAGKVIQHRWEELSGSEVVVEGTTYSDATIGAPSVVAAPVVEEEAESTTQ